MVLALALTWTGWSGLLATVGVILAVWARHAWRAAVREELLDYLAHAAPDVAVSKVHVNATNKNPSRTASSPLWRRVSSHSNAPPPEIAISASS